MFSGKKFDFSINFSYIIRCYFYSLEKKAEPFSAVFIKNRDKETEIFFLIICFK